MTLLLATVALAPAQTGTLVVLNKGDHTATLFDVASGKSIVSVPVGRGPHECAISPDGRFVAVANYGDQQPGNSVTLIDLKSKTAARTLDLGEYTRPHGIEWLDNTSLLATSEQRRAVIQIGARTGKVGKSFATEQAVSHMLALSPNKKRLYTTNIGSGSLTAIDLPSGKILGHVQTGAAAEGLDVSPNGKEIWVSNGQADTVSVVDAASLKVVANVATGRRPLRVKMTPDGNRALVTCAEGGEIQVIDAKTRKLIKTIKSQDLGLSYPAGSPGPVPIGVVVHSSGKEAYVACNAARAIVVLDLATFKVTRKLATGNGPDGMALASAR